MSTKTQHIINARKLVRSMHSGVLSTISLSNKGFPFGSVTPYLMTEAGDIVIYASDIAQHSRNMKTDSHVSLCINDGSQDDSQASARVTVLAHAKPDDVDEATQAQYFELFPKAKGYVQAHDFRFYLLRVERVRYIGGFGEIYWFSQSDWRENLHILGQQSTGIVAHMNEDHQDALNEMLKHFTTLKPSNSGANMISCFADGFHVVLDKQVVFIPFLEPLSGQNDARKAMVDLVKVCRESRTKGKVDYEQAS